eukprot:6186621-Pleurochrysis_carterae.AAC.1
MHNPRERKKFLTEVRSGLCGEAAANSRQKVDRGAEHTAWSQRLGEASHRCFAELHRGTGRVVHNQPSPSACATAH